MGAYEKWVVKEGDEYIEHAENDGPSFLRHGPQASKKVLTHKQTIQYLEEKIKHQEANARPLTAREQKGKEFAERLKHLLTYHGVKQTELAKGLNMRQPTLSAWLTGTIDAKVEGGRRYRLPGRHRIGEVARYFNSSWLIDGEGTAPTGKKPEIGNVPLLHELEKIALKLSFTADNLTATCELIQRLAGEISGIQEKIKKE